MFLGAWRVWNSYAARLGLPVAQMPAWAAISFMGVYDSTAQPANRPEESWAWDDHAGANRYFLKQWLCVEGARWPA